MASIAASAAKASVILADLDKVANLVHLSQLGSQPHSVVNCLFIGPDSKLTAAHNSFVRVSAECPCTGDPWRSPDRLVFVRVCCDVGRALTSGADGIGDLAAAGGTAPLEKCDALAAGGVAALETGGTAAETTGNVVAHPALIFNLLRSGGGGLRHLRCPTVRLRASPCTASDAAASAVARARTLRLALSPSPTYPWRHSGDAAAYPCSLAELFATQQCLYSGDVLAVPMCQIDANCAQAPAGTVLYYTVTEASSGFEPLTGPFLAGLEFSRILGSASPAPIASYAPRLRPPPPVPLARGFVDRLADLLGRCLDAWPQRQLSRPPALLLHGPAGSGKAAAVEAAAARLALHVRVGRGEDVAGQSSAASTDNSGGGGGFAGLLGECLADGAPCILLLRDAHLLARRRDGGGGGGADPGAVADIGERLARCLAEGTRPSQPLLIVGTCRSLELLDPAVLALFQLDLAVPAPDETDRRAALASVVAGASCGDVLELLVRRSAGFNAGELAALIRRARLAECGIGTGNTPGVEAGNKPGIEAGNAPGVEAGNAPGIEAGNKASGEIEARIDPPLLIAALEATLRGRAAAMGAPRLPPDAAVDWEDVGGQEAAVAEILATVEAPLMRPQLLRHRRCGLLLYGPPGVGKTLLARAAAGQLGLVFLSVKGPELMNMYVGQSEANVRALFADAARLAPCVVFFDELDSIAPARGGGGGSGAVDRIVSQLLTELDGIRMSDTAVFVIGATNRADLLDRALLRPGRFDRAILVPPAASVETKTALLRAQLRRRPCAPDVDPRALAAALPDLVTGADVMSVVAAAADLVLQEAVSAIDSGVADKLTVDCRLCQATLMRCAKELEPSVTAEQMLVYERMRI